MLVLLLEVSDPVLEVDDPVLGLYSLALEVQVEVLLEEVLTMLEVDAVKVDEVHALQQKWRRKWQQFTVHAFKFMKLQMHSSCLRVHAILQYNAELLQCFAFEAEEK